MGFPIKRFASALGVAAVAAALLCRPYRASRGGRVADAEATEFR